MGRPFHFRHPLISKEYLILYFFFLLFFSFLKKTFTPHNHLKLKHLLLSSKGNSQNSNHQQAATPQEASISQSKFNI
uniref:Uncharacterized protein n=1 Tax=Daucus carota subsp. sativus TaxID=79200 RepID=A0A161ZKG1_DAUCS